MLARGTFSIGAISLLVCWSWCTHPAAGQADETLPLPQVEKSKYQATGSINRNDAYVHSGPGTGYYPTMKLDKGAKVTVVGIQFDWLKIVPPEGSFSYVPKIHVERTGDGKVGRVTGTEVRVRAGSSLNEMKVALQTQLNENDRVTIVGEKDEFFMVQPPAGAYLYVNKQDVDVVSVAPAGESGNAASAPQETAGQPGQTGGPIPATQPTETQVAGTATSQPTAESVAQEAAQNQFAAMEQQFDQASAKPLVERPIAELMAGYEPLASGDKLPESLRRVAASRLAVLKVQAQDQVKLTELQKSQDERAQRQQAARVEREELQQHIQQTQIKRYAAVGELQPSSIQQGAGTLYRLVDPANKRTIVYIRTNDPGCGALISQFVGVTGEITTENQLPNAKVVWPKVIEPVDPARLADTVTAQIIPPSLAPKTAAEAPSPAATTNP